MYQYYSSKSIQGPCVNQSCQQFKHICTYASCCKTKNTTTPTTRKKSKHFSNNEHVLQLTYSCVLSGEPVTSFLHLGKQIKLKHHPRYGYDLCVGGYAAWKADLTEKMPTWNCPVYNHVSACSGALLCLYVWL
jgi:hypothetical protein